MFFVWRNVVLMGVGTCLLIFGVAAVFTWPRVFQEFLHRSIALSEDSLSYHTWRETPPDIPVYMSIFMFNVTNVGLILGGGGDITPRVEEVGPYVFDQVITKVNVTWYDNGTVSYYNQKTWIFNSERSNGSLTDMVTSLNPTITSVAYLMRHESIALRFGVDFALSLIHKDQFLTANVSSWLFEGIHDPIMEMANNLYVTFTLPDRIGWFYGRNNSIDYEGNYLMNTGAEDFAKIGRVEKWRWTDRTPYNTQCGQVYGSSGEFWSLEPGQDKISFFAPDICTALVLPKKGNLNINGVEGTLFQSDYTLFDNGSNIESAACYCEQDCMPSGALNASLCYNGPPVFVSSPHFYGADPFYTAKVDGLDSNTTDQYAFRMVIEPVTGLPLMVNAQVQVNLLVRRVPNIYINNNLPDDTVVPIFWSRQEFVAPPEYLAMIKTALATRYNAHYAFEAIICLGAILLCWGFLTAARSKGTWFQSKPVLEEKSNYNYFPEKY